MSLRPLVGLLLLVLAVLIFGLAVSMVVASRSLGPDAGLGGSGWAVIVLCGVVAGVVAAVAVSILRAEGEERRVRSDDRRHDSESV